MRGNGNDRSPVTLSSNLVLSPLFNVFPTGPHSKGLGSTSSYTALPEPGNAGGRAEMQGSGNDRGPVTEALGLKHTSTLHTVNNLGALYGDQGKLAEAEAMYIRALQGYEEALGPKHTSTMQMVNNLGALYGNQGKLAEEEAMYI